MTELIRRAQDLSRRCEQKSIVTNTGFLTPAECYELSCRLKSEPGQRAVFHGGHPEAERKTLFFLPFWMEELPVEEHLHAVRITAEFGTLSHRDYLGAILGLGIGRQWVGDILLQGKDAYVLCFEQVQRHILQQLTHVGRYGVKVEEVALEEIPAQQRQVKEISFTVQSMRLDAVVGGLFRLSRTQAAEKIRLGAVSLNYAPCLRPDAFVKPEDIISLRGSGKGRVLETGGTSRKGRLFLNCEIWQ